jgi:hypothetical protein
VAEAFLKDQITIGHALLIAKLPASQQPEAFSAAFRGLWTSEGNSQVLIPVRELAAWIESNILLQLASAPFDKQDETLVPEAGSCVRRWNDSEVVRLKHFINLVRDRVTVASIAARIPGGPTGGVEIRPLMERPA